MVFIFRQWVTHFCTSVQIIEISVSDTLTQNCVGSESSDLQNL